jgi:nicotinamide-nucleotide amidase
MLNALRFAARQAPLVIVTGGLGPTPNDITREVLAEFAGMPLREEPAVLAEMERRMNQPRDQLRPNLRRQARVPEGGKYLQNPNGSAVGLVFDLTNSVVVALPGPPRELQGMTEQELIPYLRGRFGIRQLGSALTLRFVGAGQSLIDQTIKDRVPLAPDVVVTSIFEGSRVDFTFSLPGHAPADRGRLQALADQIRAQLSDYLYATNRSTLEEVVTGQLSAKGGRLVLVELGSGGALAAALQSAEGVGGVLAGAYVADSESAAATLLGLAPGALPEAPLAKIQLLASKAVAATQSNWALAVGPVQQVSERGGKGVLLALQSPDGLWVTQLLAWRNPGEITRSTLSTDLLDFLRRRLR